MIIEAHTIGNPFVYIQPDRLYELNGNSKIV